MNNLPRQSPSALPIRYLLVIWLFVLSAVAYLDRTNISIAGIQIGKEFAIDNTHLGWVFSAFLIGYAAFQVPAGLLVHKFGTRMVLTFAVLWWGLFTVLTALVSPTLRASVIIVVHYGWRASFWFSAVVGVIAGTVWYLMARETPEEHRLVRASELDRILQDRKPTPDTISSNSLRPTGKRTVPWVRIFSSKEVFAVTLSYFCFGYVAWVFFGWFYIYIAQARG